MKLFIVFSGDESQETSIPRAYTRTWDDSFAQRVLMHLTNDVNLCTGCAEFCEHCRDQYPIQFAQDVVGLLQFPARLPVYIELSLIHISEPTRRTPISYAVFCLKKK